MQVTSLLIRKKILNIRIDQISALLELFNLSLI